MVTIYIDPIERTNNLQGTTLEADQPMRTGRALHVAVNKGSLASVAEWLLTQVAGFVEASPSRPKIEMGV